MSFTFRVVRGVLALALLLPAAVSAAPDCDGGTMLKLRADAGRVAFQGTVTRAGLTHANFLAGGDLHFRIVRADGGDFYTVDIPAAHFVTHGSQTTYDHGDTFQGDVILKKAPGQADTVRITIRSAKGAGAAEPLTGDMRAYVTTGASCSRSCVAPCTDHGGGTGHHSLRCRRSDTYVPGADLGFGALTRAAHGAINALCGLEVDTNPDCDFLIEDSCLLPYPSSFFLAADGSTPTGLRIHYAPTALPQKSGGPHIDPTDWNTLDGFSPGPVILSLFPDTGSPVDLTASNVAFHTDFARSLDADHPTVIMNASTGERVVHFAEMDANTNDVARKSMIIRPGKRLDDATRYLVAIRNLVDTNGAPIHPRLAFRALRDGASQAQIASACGPACAAAFAPRIALFVDIMSRLQSNGVDPSELVLAWDFTTASQQALTGWITSIRDQAFALGTPAFTVDSVNNGGGAGKDANIYAEIAGHFQAPLFMTADAPASRLNLVGGVPTQNGYANVPYLVEIPRSVYNGSGPTTPGRPSLWGHGLLGDRT